MGKRAKKKMVQGGGPVTRAGSKATLSATSSSSAASSSTASPFASGRLVENGGAAVDTSTRCPHGANLDKLRTQLAKSSAPIHCQDCAKLRSAVSAGKEQQQQQQRKGNKGSSKVVRKRGPSSSPLMADEKKANYKLWACLFCGQVGCGEWKDLNNSVGGGGGGGGELSKTEAKQGIVGRGHAWQHWLQLKHPMVMLCEEGFTCWCFICEMAHEVPHHHHHHSDVVPSESSSAGNPSSLESEEDASASPPLSRLGVLQHAAKLIWEKLVAERAADAIRVESQQAESNNNNAVSEEAEKPRARSPGALENSGQEKEKPAAEAPMRMRVIKGLVNLGNTCFFNSVMQNLLSVELLRSHFGPESSSPEGGALTSSLRKFFVEASFQSLSSEGAAAANGGLLETGTKKGAKAGGRGGWSSVDGTYNPRGLFGAICSKVPRFKGFQQQDSHELLRCLLDGLHTEEERARTDRAPPPKPPRSGGGEDALRALSETTDARDNSEDAEDSSSPRQDDDAGSCTTVEEKKGLNGEQKKTIQRPETFVERVFGGQLSSTVSCCECGHSSVVYESFLDLSLPIPSRKPSPKKALALANGTMASLPQTKSQKAEAVKNAKASRNSKADSNFEAFGSAAPAGLGTPLLLLPAPVPKEENKENKQNTNCDSSTGIQSSSDVGWLDYIDPGRGAGEADWYDFLDDDCDLNSAGIIGCAPNPTPESSTVVALDSSAPSLESEIVFGCPPNPDLMKPSSSEISAAAAAATAAAAIAAGKGILGPAGGDVSFYSSVDFEDEPLYSNGYHGDSFSEPNGNTMNPNLGGTSFSSEKFTLLEAASEAIAEANKMPSSGGCGAGLRPMGGQGMDLQVQMRGGSETTPGREELNASILVSEQQQQQQQHLFDSDCLSVEQSAGADCNDDTISPPLSDIISGPNGGTIILLGPPPPADNGSADIFSNVELGGEYDGVGSLFQEEDDTNNNNEENVYGPFPLNQQQGGGAGAGFQESSYEELVFDDVLDLSKIGTSSEARPDWLVANEDGQGSSDENAAETAMSLEGCLQIFTRSELLSGENAWACENCTKKYHEKLAMDERVATAMIAQEKPPLATTPQMPSVKRDLTNGEIAFCGNGSGNDASIGHNSIASDGFEDGEVGTNGNLSENVSVKSENGCVKSEEIASSSNVDGAETEPSAASCGMNGHTDSVPLSSHTQRPMNGDKDDDAVQDAVEVSCEDAQPDNAERAENTSGHVSSEPSDPQQGAVIESKPDAEIEPTDEARALVGTVAVSSSRGNEVDYDKKAEEEAETNNANNAPELEKKANGGSGRNSCKTSTTKLRKSKSRKGSAGEQKKVIKQDATKRFLISRAPPVLTIQLKRFAQDMRGRLSKLSGHVAFQELLDLHPFLDHRSVNFDCKYRLIGTVEHSGTLKSGHYVAFVRGPPTLSSSTGLKNDAGTPASSGGDSSWYYISDSHVHQTNLEAVLRSEAYLVFYERVDTIGASQQL